MNNYTTLIGTEEVSRAAREMSSAASTINSAMQSFGFEAHVLHNKLYEFMADFTTQVDRLESLVKKIGEVEE